MNLLSRIAVVVAGGVSTYVFIVVGGGCVIGGCFAVVVAVTTAVAAAAVALAVAVAVTVDVTVAVAVLVATAVAVAAYLRVVPNLLCCKSARFPTNMYERVW